MYLNFFLFGARIYLKYIFSGPKIKNSWKDILKLKCNWWQNNLNLHLELHFSWCKQKFILLVKLHFSLYNNELKLHSKIRFIWCKIKELLESRLLCAFGE